jgi:hypothetical protein
VEPSQRGTRWLVHNQIQRMIIAKEIQREER